jgi:hypothetical protein
LVRKALSSAAKRDFKAEEPEDDCPVFQSRNWDKPQWMRRNTPAAIKKQLEKCRDKRKAKRQRSAQQQQQQKQQQQAHRKDWRSRGVPWRSQSSTATVVDDGSSDHDEGLSILQVSGEDDTICMVSASGVYEGWEWHSATVDSGSAVNGLPSHLMSKWFLDEAQGQMTYTSASQHSVHVEGKKLPECWLQNDMQGTIEFKVLTELHKVIISTSKMTKAGFRVVHDSDGSYARHKASGKTLRIFEKNGVFVIPIWMRTNQPGPRTWRLWSRMWMVRPSLFIGRLPSRKPTPGRGRTALRIRFGSRGRTRGGRVRAH